VGVVCGAGQLDIVLVIVLLISAALLGDTSGYLLGRSSGPHIFNRPDSRIPIIRTFAAFIAGVGRMNLARFLSFDVFGVTGWVVLMTMLGYKLGASASCGTTSTK